jgi:hypothetical protein
VSQKIYSNLEYNKGVKIIMGRRKLTSKELDKIEETLSN